MNSEDLCYTPAVELARMIREKSISPVELTEAILERIAAHNPTLNAYCAVTGEAAMDAARAAEQAVMNASADGAATGGQDGGLGPLHGIPVSIKDLIFTRGVPTMGGSHIYAERVPEIDAPVVTRLKEAGGIVLGKTTTPEFGWKGLSDCPLTGATHNPWKHGMTAGGSSAGAAASVAAGMGPLAQGSDGAGSIRIPSAFSGIYGIKPSFGRVPNYPFSNNDNTTHIGPMTRTVADAALMLAVMAGSHDWDSYSLEGPPADYVGRLDEGIEGLKVAFSPDLGYLRVDPEVAGPVRDAVEAFSELGCAVEEVDPGFGDTSEMAHFFWNVHLAGNWGPYLDEWEEKMDPGLVAAIEDGQRHSATDYMGMRARKIAFYDTVRGFFDRYDLLLTPSLSVAAFPVGQLMPDHWPDHPWNWMQWASFSYPFNLSGTPTATVPAGITPAGLPVGLQIAGGRHQDLRVLQASAAFEKARPWAQHRPQL